MARDSNDAPSVGAVSLRRRLLLLAGVAVLPLALMSGVALRALWKEQHQQLEGSTLALTRALAIAVDSDLRVTISALQILALTQPLDETGEVRLDAGRRLAADVLASRPEWRAILLARPDGERVFATGETSDEAAAALSEPESFRQVVSTGKPVVGSLARGPQGHLGIAVRVPVLSEGRLRYVLTAVLRPEAILRVLREQRIPEEWVASVFDANNLRIARSREHEKYLATPAGVTLQALTAKLGGDVEAMGPTETLEGQTVYTAVTRLQSVRWTLTLGQPTAVGDRAERDSQIAFGGGIVFSLALGGLAAWLSSRRILRPIARLRDSAEALGRGDPVEPAGADVIEIEAVSDALLHAAALRSQSESERQRLLDAERDARSGAERARARLQLLASATSLLSRSLEERTTLEAIASLIVPELADVCRIDLLDEQGTLQRKLTHHLDPARAQEIARFVGQRSSSPETPGSFPWAIATGQTYLVNFRAEDAHAEADEEFREFIRMVGICAVCAVPLVARGRTIGVMAAIQAESGRRFSAEDGALIEELAARAALALDNVRLFGDSEAARRQAEVANLAKDEFMAMLGHELRNPLAPIVTSLELMARLPGNPAADARRVISRQVAHLSRLVDDLLDVSRIASGKVELHLETVDLREVVERALEQSEPALRLRSAPIEVVLPPVPVHVQGDPLRLVQVICNLLVNAAKFSDVDERIAVEVRDAATPEIVVSDNGVGISAELMPRLFERFVQGEQALERRSGGLGLGLAIARNLVQLHGGTIRAESGGPGRGSRFFVTLPRSGAATAASPAAAPRLAAAARPTRVLFVDDNEDAALALSSLLELEGFEVRTAASGEEALAMLPTFPAEVAVLDLGLPGIDGYELARRLRADPATASIRLIALTGYGRDSDRRRALQAGFDEHTVKPLSIEQLLRVIEALASGT